jgi:hypothetical protein
MKKFRCIIAMLLVFAFIVPVFATEETKPSVFSEEYYDSFMSTMDFMEQVKERMKALTEKEEPTDAEVELCIQYIQIYIRLMTLCAAEMGAPNDKVEAPSYEDIDKAANQARLVYRLGAMDGKELITGLVTAALGEK